VHDSNFQDSLITEIHSLISFLMIFNSAICSMRALKLPSLSDLSISHPPPLQGSRLPRWQWVQLRSSLPRPRRLSARFLAGERERLARQRQYIRDLQVWGVGGGAIFIRATAELTKRSCAVFEKHSNI
jgi:hypothetical protein